MSDETKTGTWEQRIAREREEARAHDLARDKAWHDRQLANMRGEREAGERHAEQMQKKAEAKVSERLREQTAATILAALVRNEGILVSAPMRVTEQDAEFIAYAVALADALRAALKGTP
jgi:hypothetical protein